MLTWKSIRWTCEARWVQSPVSHRDCCAQVASQQWGPARGPSGETTCWLIRKLGPADRKCRVDFKLSSSSRKLHHSRHLLARIWRRPGVVPVSRAFLFVLRHLRFPHTPSPTERRKPFLSSAFQRVDFHVVLCVDSRKYDCYSYELYFCLMELNLYYSGLETPEFWKGH